MVSTVTGLSDSQRQRLFNSHGRRFSTGEVVYRQGEPAQQIYVLQEGRVRLVKRVRLVERNLVVLDAGDLFGEIALSDRDEVYPSTAVTLTESSVLCFEARTFGTMVHSHPELALRLMRQLVRRLGEAEDQVENMLIKDRQSRVVNALLKASRRLDRRADEPLRLKMTPVELSSRVGLDVDTIKRVVHELRKGEYLKVYDDQLVIPSVEALEKLFELIGMKEDLRRG